MTTNTLSDITSNIKNKLENKANDSDVLKLVAQVLTPEQKNQLLNNLSDLLLPSGGGIFTDSVAHYRQKDTSSRVVIRGGDAYDTGSFIGLYGQNQTDFPGEFVLGATNSTLRQQSYLVGKPDGTLQWLQNDIACFDEVLGGSETRLDTTIKFSNGLMIFYNGFRTGTIGKFVGTYPIPFKRCQPISGACVVLDAQNSLTAASVPKVVLATTNGYTNYTVLAKRADDSASAADVFVYFWAFGRWK